VNGEKSHAKPDIDRSRNRGGDGREKLPKVEEGGGVTGKEEH